MWSIFPYAFIILHLVNTIYLLKVASWNLALFGILLEWFPPDISWGQVSFKALLDLWLLRALQHLCYGFPAGSVHLQCRRLAGDKGLIPGSGRSPGAGNGNPLQYSCLGNPMDRGSWQATVYGVAKSWTRLRMHTHPEAHMYMKFKEICIWCAEK